MLHFNIPLSRANRPRILCIGAHSDDIEIGCGGTILRLLHEKPRCEVEWVVFSASANRRKEALTSAGFFLKQAQSSNVIVRSFRDGFFPYQGSKIKQEFEAIKRTFEPDLVFTHYRHDLHQDHRLLNELTWNTFRNHTIFEYEILKYDGDLGTPNCFVPLTREFCERKVGFILRAFKSQAKKQWFDRETFIAMLRVRGVECASTEKYAEAFYCRKIALCSAGTLTNEANNT